MECVNSNILLFGVLESNIFLAQQCGKIDVVTDFTDITDFEDTVYMPRSCVRVGAWKVILYKYRYNSNIVL